MKKLSSDDLQRNKILLKKRTIKQLLREVKRRRRIREHNHVSKAPLESNPSLSARYKEVDFNHDIDIYQESSRKKMSEKCQDIRGFRGDHIHLSFKSDEMKITAAGMLWLYAEIYRILQIKKIKITCDYPTNRKAERVFQHIDFFKLIKIPERIPDSEIRKAGEDVLSWHVIIGNTFAGADVSEFLEKISPSMEQDNKVYIAVKEMIGNVTDHAYEKNASFRPWIAFGRINEEGRIVIVVGDLGKTIPNTIKKYPLKLKGFSGKMLSNKIDRWHTNDSKLIGIATGLRQSVTLESHRGLGLNNAIQNIKHLQGSLLIHSKSGFYDSRLSQKNRKAQKNKDKEVIRGTIVQISIPLPPPDKGQMSIAF